MGFVAFAMLIGVFLAIISVVFYQTYLLKAMNER